MDEELKGRIITALKAACLPDADPEIALEESGPTRVGGAVVSTRFAGMTPSARQDLIWEHLDAALSPHERTLISFLVADTREERDALAEPRAHQA